MKDIVSLLLLKPNLEPEAPRFEFLVSTAVLVCLGLKVAQPQARADIFRVPELDFSSDNEK